MKKPSLSKVSTTMGVTALVLAAAATNTVQADYSVECQMPYALCAYANCTVNEDGKTASCGCYAFDSGVSSAIVALTPDADVESSTRAACPNATACDVGEAPLCSAMQPSSSSSSSPTLLWPGAELVSTYSSELAEENKNPFGSPDNEGNVWNCSGSERGTLLVPVCMQAPCRFAMESSNPYNYGTHNVTCTCPLVPATSDYVVNGGLTNPCHNPSDSSSSSSSDVTKAGDFVQAAWIPSYAEDKEAIQANWDAVRIAFEEGETRRQ